MNAFTKPPATATPAESEALRLKQWRTGYADGFAVGVRSRRRSTDDVRDKAALELCDALEAIEIDTSVREGARVEAAEYALRRALGIEVGSSYTENDAIVESLRAEARRQREVEP